ncbi:MAG: M14 family zinc carboxypeptidase [Candidatus Cloacimonadaceae bacterium]|nr:zinc carboxypeptidase [Candidatus Cloacimonadota bacterium]MCK9241953.1 zinc carboxypeptidase [Candidatus Cloacimonadota bacterium]
MKKLLLTSTILLTLMLLHAGEQNEYYFRFELRDMDSLPELGQIVSIDNIKGYQVYAYANDSQWAAFKELGLPYQILPHPGINPEAKMASNPDQMRSWDSYPTYDAYLAMMYGFAADYPNLCEIVDVGTTVGGRKILFARISDNVSLSEPKPQLMYTATMHGDETVGYVLMLRLIDTLLSGYPTDPRLSNLVNNAEIWINPNANPDGTYYSGNHTVSGSRRYNLNGYDLNRNFPSPSGTQYSGQALQTETQLMMGLALAQSFRLVANFHGGAEVVNYPWDFQAALHADDAWYQSISRAYASSAQAHSPAGYLTFLNNGITNGAQWYVTTGNRQDWTNYATHSREVTIELSNTKNPPASTLPDYWNYNYDALLGFLEAGLYGIHGVVKDAWGNPLDASITVVNHDDGYSTIKTDPAHGTFYRYLSPGSYDLVISTSSYEDILAQNLIVSSNASTPLQIIFGELPDLQEISLSSGWNQISFNVMPEEPGSILDLIPHLQQIKSLTESYNPDLPAYFNTLTNIDPCLGYYVKVSDAAAFEIAGSLVQPQAIALKSGWNFIGYTPDTPMAINAALASVLPYLLELRQDDLSYNQGTLLQMHPGKGYWIQLSQDCVLEY